MTPEEAAVLARTLDHRATRSALCCLGEPLSAARERFMFGGGSLIGGGYLTTSVELDVTTRAGTFRAGQIVVVIG
jgi:hypothetical protein